MVDEPFKQPNWYGSIFSLTSSINQLTTKSSNTLDKQEVKDIGLVSPSLESCCTLGIGMMLDSFQIFGTTLDDRDALMMMVAGSARTCANVFKIRLGRLSGAGCSKPV